MSFKSKGFINMARAQYLKTLQCKINKVAEMVKEAVKVKKLKDKETKRIKDK